MKIQPTYYDTPFIYVKNYIQAFTSTSPLTGPTGVLDDVIPSDGDSDFFARRAIGVYNLQNASQQYLISDTTGGTAGQNGEYFLGPEKFYPRGAGVRYQVTIANGAITSGSLAGSALSYPGAPNVTVFLAAAIMQGVKRWGGTPNTTPNYPFIERGYTYVLPFNYNWTYLATPYPALAVNPNRSFTVPVLNFDFELWGIEISTDVNSLVSGPGFQLRLYDSNNVALMNDFVHYRAIALNGGFASRNAPGVVGNTITYEPNCFPCPPVLYPRGSQIKIDIQSLLDSAMNGAGTTYINFRGVNRESC